MLVLAIDTATPAVTTGLVHLDTDGAPGTLAQQITVDPRAHGELLTPHIKATLAEADTELGQLDAIVVGAGPGPFTGLRVGMVTAAALGHALGCPVHPVATLDAIAHDVFAAAPAEPLLVATDARRREIYWARYDETGARVDGPHVERPADVTARGLEVERAAGHGAELYADVLGLHLIPPPFPSPEGLVGVAADALRSGAEPAPLTPLYLRRPDAVEPGARKRVTQP
ncbi:tRNA (adenosine(37)-N6)-threonylcarbamoyltransferase complex dimerization subunit type 1 TsaB [Longimycelium tulufanense]|uniref:tRNA (adenosine(37)-N6)-threonylcarbamoyltransferase complex dimerization subunit type 1 TsaB n=1 Tax=Longimycelium tulufanense TaxID=907463 RepID=UPI001665A2FB|nr:tRNA (adenosine(37)-N6)-threonylcarbamoyltransferase complex dimerization subunit type 1 TsaB [Longimycelium tulufanense]